MDKGHRNILAVLVAAVMAVALFSAFSINWFHKTPAVVLPSLTPTPSVASPSDAPAGDYQRVEVDRESVQRVVATLVRPESYARTITVETLEGETVLGVTTSSVTVDGGWTRSETTLPDGRVCHSLVGEGKRYVWYGQDKSWQEYDAGERTADLSQWSPTYEDILAADPENIQEVRYEMSGSIPCIYVAVQEPELGYLEEYWISVDMGLLVHGESGKDGAVFYRMSGYTVETPATPGTVFALPDGTVLHTTTLSDPAEDEDASPRDEVQPGAPL